MNGEWAAGGMPMAPVPLDHPDMAAGSGASPHSSQSGSHGGHSHHSSSHAQQHAGHISQFPPRTGQNYHHQQQQQYTSSQQGGAGGGDAHHRHHNAQHTYHQQFQKQPLTESSIPLDKHKQPPPLHQHQRHHQQDYEGSTSSTGGGSGFNAHSSGMENQGGGGGGGVDLAEMRQSFTSSNDDGPEDWQEREERLLIKQQQMLTELKRSQKAEQKAKARISELRTSLREALKENEDLLKDMEKMIFNYETLEKKHEMLTEVCSDLQLQLEQQPSSGGDASGNRNDHSLDKDRRSGQSNEVDAELLERMEQEQDFLIQKLEISQQNCQAWKDRAHAMKQHKKDLKKKCKHLESILRGCPNCQYEVQQYHQQLPSSHVGSHYQSHSHSSPEEFSSSISPPGYGSSQGQGGSNPGSGAGGGPVGGKHLQALNAGMQILNQQPQLSPRSHMQKQQHSRMEAVSNHQYSQQQQQPNQQMQQQKHQRRGSNASVGSHQSFNSHGTPRYHPGSSNVGNPSTSQSMSNSDSRSISSRSTTRKAGQQPSAMDRLVAMAKHSTSVRQLQHVHAERQQQQAFDKDADDDDERSISTRGSEASSRGAGAQSTRSSVKNGPTRHNRRPSFDLEDSGSSGSSDEKDQRKDLTRQKSLELFGSVRGQEVGSGGGGDQGCDVNSIAESYKQAKEIIQSRRKRRSTAATSQAAQHYMSGPPDAMSLRSHGDSQRLINHYNDPENDDEGRSLHDSGDLGGASFYDGSTMTSDSNLRRSSGESIQLVIVPGDGSGESQTLEIKAGHKNKGGSIILMGGSGAGNLGDHSRNRRRSSLEFNPSSSAAAHASRHFRNHEPLLQQPDYHDDHEHLEQEPESEQDISEMHESETSSLASWDRARRSIDQQRNAQGGHGGHSSPVGNHFQPDESERHMTNQRVTYNKQKHGMNAGGAASGGMAKLAAGEEHEMSQTFDAFRNRRGSGGVMPEGRRDSTGASPYSLSPKIKSKARAA